MEQAITHGSYFNTTENVNIICDESLGRTKISPEVQELFTNDSLLELCNSFWVPSPGAKSNVQPYLRGCKWSPDGTCCLSVVNHDGFHVMELPHDLYDGWPTKDRMITLLPSVIHVKESGLIYDFCWYPKMNSHYPETCSWISTKINSPIQMWDAYNGTLKCSYRGYNAVDEMEPALSVMFVHHGQHVVGGYKNCLRTFDVERPGRDFTEHKINSPASCIATNGNLLAVGSWNTSIKLFSIYDSGTYRSIGRLHAHTGGITHLKFTPDGTKLVSGARKDHSICVWDVRYHRRPLNILKRCVSTNQRIYFDISSCGRYLVSGGTDGVIRVWDNMLTKWTEQFNVKRANEENATFRFRLHSDCCNSVSIHPSRPILATGSGQFHILDPVKALDFECDNGSNCEISTEKPRQASNIQASNEEEETADMDLNEEHDKFSSNVDEICVQDCSENILMAAVEEFSIETPDQHIAEESSAEKKSTETSGEPPPTKKLKWNSEINPTKSLEKITNNEAPVPITNHNTTNNFPSEVYLHEDNLEPKHDAAYQSTELNGRRERLSEDESQGNELQMNTIVSQITEKGLAQSTKASNLDINEPPDGKDSPHSKSKQHDTNECTINNNVSIQSPAKHDIAMTVPDNLTSVVELCTNSEQAILSKSLQASKEENASQFPAKQTKLSVNTSRSSIKKTYLGDYEQLPDGKPTIDSDSESDNDCNDTNDNKMKYSSYSENNLTFWWIGNVFEKPFT